MQINLFTKPCADETIWFAQFIDAPHIVDAMGTNLLPTAFNARASSDKVRAHLQRHYPDTVIRVLS